ncbi:DUF7221 family queuine tRNA-ribosyltransferase-like protein [Actinomadura oligospora]|uniref:deazapurine DNA modification protein DpdA family protein n=1 Tax=Actinomadura oligospora TaxID=111804 RepID=UPI001B80124E|nr:hypothetical protein [Actinomadura oligospora]
MTISLYDESADRGPSTNALFYLGAHQPHWLWQTDFPLFVSHRQLARKARLRPSTCRKALDSGGFTEISLNGKWVTAPEQYTEAVVRYTEQAGPFDFISPQDWMCEPSMVERTGLSVREHQHRTVANYLTLRELAPSLPWMPVVQGWSLPDYVYCVELYASAGVDLGAMPRVGLGSVCRRQSTGEIGHITATLAGLGLRLHGFGVKTQGLARYGLHLASADSMAWSYSARRMPALPGCTGHKNCANCLTYARQWRNRLLTGLATRGQQAALFTTDTTSWGDAP